MNRLQTGILPLLRIHRFDFRNHFPQMFRFSGIRHGLLKLLHFRIRRTDFPPSLRELLQTVFQMRKTIQRLQLNTVFHQSERLFGTVHIHKQLSDGPENLRACRRRIDEDPSPGRRKHSPHQQRRILSPADSQFIQKSLQRFFRFRINPELSGNLTAIGSLTDHGFIEPAAEQQGDSAHQHRFSRPGLSGYDIESGRELQIGLIHQSKIFNMEPLEHGSLTLRRICFRSRAPG